MKKTRFTEEQMVTILRVKPRDLDDESLQLVLAKVVNVLVPFKQVRIGVPEPECQAEPDWSGFLKRRYSSVGFRDTLLNSSEIGPSLAQVSQPSSPVLANPGET
jgi:hypothetical protein